MIMNEESDVPIKKVISKKEWKFTFTIYEDGSSRLNRVNDGFLIHELMGLLEFTKAELLQQMNGTIIPDIITRTVIN